MPDAPCPLPSSPTRTERWEVISLDLRRKGEQCQPSMSPGWLGCSSSSTEPAHQEFAEEVGTDIKNESEAKTELTAEVETTEQIQVKAKRRTARKRKVEQIQAKQEVKQELHQEIQAKLEVKQELHQVDDSSSDVDGQPSKKSRKNTVYCLQTAMKCVIAVISFEADRSLIAIEKGKHIIH